MTSSLSVMIVNSEVIPALDQLNVSFSWRFYSAPFSELLKHLVSCVLVVSRQFGKYNKTFFSGVLPINVLFVISGRPEIDYTECV